MKAGRRASFQASPALRRLAEAHRIALAVLLVVAAFAVVYLIAANVVLRTHLLRDLVSRGANVELRYDSAYSVWPGLVHVRSLDLAVQDHSVQFSVHADSARVQVSLPDLILRRFHATRVSLEGLAFRLRSKVRRQQAEAAWVRAFPAIDGFADPPLYEGAPPAPIPDAEYDLWQIALDDVQAELRELWLFEYRYLGTGRIARGGFRLLPARSYAVYPAHVELTRGTLSLGDRVAVQRLSLDVDAHIDTTDLRAKQGAERVEAINGQLRVDARGLDFGVLDARAPERQPRRLVGDGDLTLALAVRSGRVEPGASAQLESRRAVLATPLGELTGSFSSTLESLPEGRATWTITSPKLTLGKPARRSNPSFGSPRLKLGLHSETIGMLPELRELSGELPEFAMPSLAWAKRWLARSGVPLELGARLDGQARFSWAQGSGPSARVQLRLAEAKVSSETMHASLGGELLARVEPVGSGSSSEGRLDVTIQGTLEGARDQARKSLVAGAGGERARRGGKPLRATLRVPDLRIDLEQRAVSGGVELSAEPADPLLSAALGSPMLEDLAADVFDLRDLQAEARVNVSRRSVRFDLARAASGGLEGAGYWQRPAAGDPRGAFLISSKVANVGITLAGSDAKTAWFVADDWLVTGRCREGYEPERRSGERPSGEADGPESASCPRRARRR